MKKLLTIVFLLAMTMGLTGCGDTVEVPPAHIGKLSTNNGLAEGIIQPSKLRLSNMCITCDSIIIAETSDHPIKESMKIYMPKTLLLMLTVLFLLTAKKIMLKKSLIKFPLKLLKVRSVSAESLSQRFTKLMLNL